MTMAWVALGVGVLGAGASYAGAKKQSDAGKAAANLNMDQFRIINQQQQPFIRSGYGAMGRLNTLLGLNPNPRAAPRAPPQAWRPMPGGGVQPIMQVGIPERGGSFGIPQNAPNIRLQRILALRAANGDTEAGRILNTMGG